MKTYEYIFAAIVTVAVLLSAIFLTTLSLPLYKSVADIEQVKVATQKIASQILLSPGYPPDWGRDISVRGADLGHFGLALNTYFTREAYSLDMDKVVRLNKELGPLYIPPSDAIRSLGIDKELGMKLELIPSLVIDVRLTGSLVVIDASTEHGVPATYVDVSIVALYLRESNIALETARMKDENGDGRITFTLSSTPDVLITVANYFGITTVNLTIARAYEGYLIGHHAIFNSSVQLKPGNAIAIYATKERGPGEFYTLSYYHCEMLEWTDLDGLRVYNLTSLEPDIIAIVSLSVDNGVAVAHRPIPRVYGLIEDEVHSPISYSIERSVKVGTTTYTLRLTVWRVSW